MPRFKRKRLNISVKKYFQRWLHVRILGAVVLSSLIAALVLYFYARNEITASFFDAHIKIKRVSDLLLPVIIAGSMVSLLSGIVLSLFLPQKIAGPIFRVEQDLVPIQNGDLTTHITLREGDILTELADAVNKTTSATRVKVELCKSSLDSLIKSVEESELPKDGLVYQQIATLEQALAQLKTN